MNEWINVRLESIMHDSTNLRGFEIYGLAHYLDKLIENQIRLNELLNELILKHYKDK